MKIILKLLALPVLLLVKILCILGNLLTNISSYVIGLLLLVIGGCALLYCKSTVDFPSNSCGHGIGCISGNLYVSMGSCKAGIHKQFTWNIYQVIKNFEVEVTFGWLFILVKGCDGNGSDKIDYSPC